MSALIRSSLTLVVASAVALSGCGGSSPTSPSGKGVVLQGTVLSAAGAAGATAHAGASSASSGKTIVTVRETGISVTVSANGTRGLRGYGQASRSIVVRLWMRNGTSARLGRTRWMRPSAR